MRAMRTLVVLVLLTSAGCAGAAPAILGPLDRADVERRLPEWRAARENARPDPAAVRALGAVPPGAEVLVFLGTWCSDSLREVTRLWSALDALGAPPPFAVRWIGVDRAKREPPALLRGMGVRRVPTIVVRRAGREVGRIVETAPRGVERELLELLAADVSTASAGVGTPAPSPAPPPAPDPARDAWGGD
jgi:hypothetical protein